MSHPASPPSPAQWAAIRCFAMDVDGVLTDGTVAISSDGVETKNFSILDGMGLVRLHQAGVVVAWISGRASQALQALATQLGFSAAQICYMGDDDIDAPAITWAGIGVAPTAAMPTALQAARYTPARPAGHGAVREICEQILAQRGQ